LTCLTGCNLLSPGQIFVMGRTRGADTDHKKCSNFSRSRRGAAEITREQAYSSFSFARTCTVATFARKTRDFTELAQYTPRGCIPLTLENCTRFVPRHGRVVRCVLCIRSRRCTRGGRSRVGVAGISSDKICHSALLRFPRVTTPERRVSSDHQDTPVSPVGAGSASFFPCTRGGCSTQDIVTYSRTSLSVHYFRAG
jgi:hypothetical protein